MSTTLANEVRATNTPTFCSACFGQDSTVQHVDFDAACDRGYGQTEDNPDIKVALDDLILCETCLRDGATRIGMIDAKEQAEYVQRLERLFAEEKANCERAVSYANRMEEALAQRPQPVKVSRPRGRPPKSVSQPTTTQGA